MQKTLKVATLVLTAMTGTAWGQDLTPPPPPPPAPAPILTADLPGVPAEEIQIDGVNVTPTEMRKGYTTAGLPNIVTVYKMEVWTDRKLSVDLPVDFPGTFAGTLPVGQPIPATLKTVPVPASARLLAREYATPAPLSIPKMTLLKGAVCKYGTTLYLNSPPTEEMFEPIPVTLPSGLTVNGDARDVDGPQEVAEHAATSRRLANLESGLATLQREHDRLMSDPGHNIPRTLNERVSAGVTAAQRYTDKKIRENNAATLADLGRQMSIKFPSTPVKADETYNGGQVYWLNGQKVYYAVGGVPYQVPCPAPTAAP